MEHSAFMFVFKPIFRLICSLWCFDSILVKHTIHPPVPSTLLRHICLLYLISSVACVIFHFIHLYYTHKLTKFLNLYKHMLNYISYSCLVHGSMFKLIPLFHQLLSTISIYQCHYIITMTIHTLLISEMQCYTVINGITLLFKTNPRTWQLQLSSKHQHYS